MSSRILSRNYSSSWPLTYILILCHVWSSICAETELSASTPSRVNCAFVGNHTIRCAKEENIDVAQVGSPRLPNVLIIGASETGAAALSELLANHPEVQLGRGPEGDYDYESNFLLPAVATGNTDTGILQDNNSPASIRLGNSEVTLQQFSKSYFGGVTEDSNIKQKIIVDQAPAYSSNPLTPYMAKLVFSQRNPKFIFTVRDPLAADLSLYNMRKWADNMKLTYNDFTLPRINMFKKWWQCRERTFKQLLMGDVYTNKIDYVTTRDLYNPAVFTWQATQKIERQIYEKCDGMGYNSKTPSVQFTMFDDYYQERLYAINLRRWAQVYGEESILCFTNTDFIDHQPKIKKMVAAHLGIDPGQLTSSSSIPADAFESDFNRTSTQTLSLASSVGVQESQSSLGAALGEVRKMLESVTTQEDLEYIRRMCKRDYEAMPE